MIHKENPKFNADFSYLQYVKGKTYELYNQLNEFGLKVVSLLIGMHFLFNINLLFCILAVFFGIIKGLFNVRPVKSRVKITKELQRNAIKHSYLYDLLVGMKNQKELTIYRAFNHFKQKWRLQKEIFDQQQLKLEKINNSVFRQQEILEIIFNAIIVVLFANLVKFNNFTMGDYVLTTMAVSVTISNISMVIGDYTRMFENSDHFNKQAEIDSYYRTFLDNPNDGQLDFSLLKNIKISDLNFSYPNNSVEVLKKINLTINKGDTVAILGENGSGKSTLVKVLLGLYETKKSHVLFDGIPMNLINKESMFKKTSVIFQDFLQYHTTIQDNIGIGDLENYHNEKRMLETLEKVDIKSLGYNLQTSIGLVDENAINLSGGQWQRVALTRFFFKENLELAIFDEPTSALDPLTELRLFKDILSRCEEITTIIISHRVGIARKADKIVIMENGSIVEQGTHKELIDLKNIYYDMWMSQQEWYQEDEKEVLISTSI
ncbi:ATP-binding cassette domain-containing protein [Paenibacillus sp. Leaf72]|uniref:ATP-binding cassette domain-containing protein n=1 Tax=Paenibacillus sp. Leaf72 TaxID=1736234 RepID=UPI00138F2771|nr:ATP-binding cassette domain-containing protein [Paenibacillus sp. Leaf72]